MNLGAFGKPQAERTYARKEISDAARAMEAFADFGGERFFARFRRLQKRSGRRRDLGFAHVQDWHATLDNDLSVVRNPSESVNLGDPNQRFPCEGRLRPMTFDVDIEPCKRRRDRNVERLMTGAQRQGDRMRRGERSLHLRRQDRTNIEIDDVVFARPRESDLHPAARVGPRMECRAPPS
jgi:hypothetical protein